MVQLYQLFYYLYKGVSLLVRTSGQSVVSHGCQQALSASPQGHFLLLPSDNSLLLKSIAVSEMMLPSDVQSPVEGPSDSALSVVASCLDQVLPNLISSQFRLQPWHQEQYVDFLFSFFSQIEFSNSYNPLLVHSDLYNCLISQSLKSNSASKPLKRRFQASQVGKSGQRMMSPKKIQLFVMIPLYGTLLAKLTVFWNLPSSKSTVTVGQIARKKSFSTVMCNSEIRWII